MSRYRVPDQHGLNYVTRTVMGWVDAQLHACSWTYQFGLPDNHPTELVSPKVIWQKVDYIPQNLVWVG